MRPIWFIWVFSLRPSCQEYRFVSALCVSENVIVQIYDGLNVYYTNCNKKWATLEVEHFEMTGASHY